MSAGQLGTEPSHVQQRLLEAFQIAAVWKTVILLDEADILLERRSIHDLQSNQLVLGISSRVTHSIQIND